MATRRQIFQGVLNRLTRSDEPEIELLEAPTDNLPAIIQEKQAEGALDKLVNMETSRRKFLEFLPTLSAAARVPGVLDLVAGPGGTYSYKPPGGIAGATGRLIGGITDMFSQRAKRESPEDIDEWWREDYQYSDFHDSGLGKTENVPLIQSLSNQYGSEMRPALLEFSRLSPSDQKKVSQTLDDTMETATTNAYKRRRWMDDDPDWQGDIYGHLSVEDPYALKDSYDPLDYPMLDNSGNLSSSKRKPGKTSFDHVSRDDKASLLDSAQPLFDPVTYGPWYDEAPPLSQQVEELEGLGKMNTILDEAHNLGKLDLNKRGDSNVIEDFRQRKLPPVDTKAGDFDAQATAIAKEADFQTKPELSSNVDYSLKEDGFKRSPYFKLGSRERAATERQFEPWYKDMKKRWATAEGTEDKEILEHLKVSIPEYKQTKEESLDKIVRKLKRGGPVNAEIETYKSLVNKGTDILKGLNEGELYEVGHLLGNLKDHLSWRLAKTREYNKRLNAALDEEEKWQFRTGFYNERLNAALDEAKTLGEFERFLLPDFEHVIKYGRSDQKPLIKTIISRGTPGALLRADRAINILDELPMSAVKRHFPDNPDAQRIKRFLEKTAWPWSPKDDWPHNWPEGWDEQ